MVGPETYLYLLFNNSVQSHCSYSQLKFMKVSILPRAEVPRDLDIVPLPPGPLYIKNELFYSTIFQNILNKF